MESPTDDTRSLRVVVIKDGEPLPQFCAPWTLRIGTLCTELARRGHRVSWLSSTFRHNEKTFYVDEEATERREEGYDMRFLSAGSYRSNISWARWAHHSRLAWRVAKVLREGPPPDAIVCCIPILEVAAVCQIYSQKYNVPLLLDIQDPWPKVFVDYAPSSFKQLVRAALSPYFWATSQIFSRATSIVSVSRGFLRWAQQLGERDSRHKAWDRVVYIGGHRATEVVPEPYLETSGLRSLYVGACSGIYDFKPIAEMLEIQASRGDSHHMFIVGGQGDKRYQRLKSRLENLPNVTFTGWLPREKVYAIAKSCHFGWLPLGKGNVDFAPNKLFEYPALGLPVATLRQGEAGEMIEKHGIGFCYDSSGESLVEELSRLQPGGAILEGWKARCEIFARKIGDARVCAGQFADHIEKVVAYHRRPKEPAPAIAQEL